MLTIPTQFCYKDNGLLNFNVLFLQSNIPIDVLRDTKQNDSMSPLAMHVFLCITFTSSTS